MLEVSHLTKRFGSLTAVDDLSFTLAPGRVTGFLGPNGAGKTTTLRIALGLTRATAGTARFDGRSYQDIKVPMREVGAALEASSFHPGRTALDHLLMLAPCVGVKGSRCLEVLDQVGLSGVAKRRVGEFSLGMRGRLGLAVALLGDPKVLLLDEPINGLDPEGIAWIRELSRHLAASGKAVLISSHVLTEVQQSVDDVVIIAHGKLVYAAALSELAVTNRSRVLVVAADEARFGQLAQLRSWQVEPAPGGTLVVGVDAATIGHAAHQVGVELHQLATQETGLETAFLALTEGQGSIR